MRRAGKNPCSISSPGRISRCNAELFFQRQHLANIVHGRQITTLAASEHRPQIALGHQPLAMARTRRDAMIGQRQPKMQSLGSDRLKLSGARRQVS